MSSQSLRNLTSISPPQKPVLLPLVLLAVALAFAFLALWIVHRAAAVARKGPSKPRKFSPRDTSPAAHRFAPPKPPWVAIEVIRLKALMPEAGCRRIAATLGHLHEAKRGMTVSKSYVAGVIRANGEAVVRKRRELKHRHPRRMARNIIWGLDLTQVETATPTHALGVLDHGSRACLTLQTLIDRQSITILRALLNVIERFGKPKVLRTDNEPILTSKLFRLGLWFLRIRHQRTAPYCPWQNGRIERFFGTLKATLRARRAWTGASEVRQIDLDRFRTWYNHLRPHQHLGGLTPAEAWNGKTLKRRGRARFVSDWGGVLSGYWWRE